MAFLAGIYSWSWSSKIVLKKLMFIGPIEVFPVFRELRYSLHIKFSQNKTTA
jgi:hypothetical protein